MVAWEPVSIPNFYSHTDSTLAAVDRRIYIAAIGIFGIYQIHVIPDKTDIERGATLYLRKWLPAQHTDTS